MEEKKDFTIEELTKQCEEAKKNFDTLSEQLEKAKQEEKEKREAQLALEKEARKAEVDKAFDNYTKLLTAYIKDYGPYKTISTIGEKDWLSHNFFGGFF